MNTSALIQRLLDECANLIEKLQSYIDRALDVVHQIREWIHDLTNSIGEAFDYIVSMIAGKELSPSLHASHPHDADLLFV